MKKRLGSLLVCLASVSAQAWFNVINDYCGPGCPVYYTVNGVYKGGLNHDASAIVYQGDTVSWALTANGPAVCSLVISQARNYYMSECGGQPPATYTNYWDRICVTNLTSVPVPFQFYLASGGSMDNPVRVVPPNTIWCFDITNTGPFQVCAGSAQLEYSFCNPPSTPAVYTNRPGTNPPAVPPPPPPSPNPLTNNPYVPTNGIPPYAGTNLALDATLARGFNALLVQGQDAAKQADYNARTANGYLARMATNTAVDYSSLLTAIASNTMATAGNVAVGVATLTNDLDRNFSALGTNLNGGLAGLGNAVSNLAGLFTNGVSGDGPADTNGLVSNLTGGNSDFSSALAGKLGSVPTWGSAAPSYVLPFSQLGVDGLADAHFDLGGPGFSSVVPVVRGFLLFLVSVAGVFAGYRIIRSFDPS